MGGRTACPECSRHEILSRAEDQSDPSDRCLPAEHSLPCSPCWLHFGVLEAHAGKSTVCTVTVNSPNEKETLRRVLPEDKFQFVELVERGRPDWLASACRQNLRCDVLVISGHFDGGTEFYSDRLDARESLPVAELERASCSASCSGLFSQLKEVYLFGCNTLNAATPDSTAAEVARSLVRSGYSQCRRRARLARLERAPRRKQSRGHAPHIRQRSRHLRLFGDGAAGRSGSAASRPPPAVVRWRRIRQRSRQLEPARPVRRKLDDRHRRDGRTPIRARTTVAKSANSSTSSVRRRRSSPSSIKSWAATWPRCACSSSASRHFTHR